MPKFYSYPIKTVYYRDEMNDEFSSAVIEPKRITEEYKYIPKNPLWYVAKFFIYRVIMTPIAFFYTKFILHHSVKNKAALKSARGKGYFLFANHTQEIGDAFMPSTALFPKEVYTVVHPNNVSMPFLGRFTKLMGALPTPTTYKAMKGFRHAIEHRINGGAAVVIYPEAHIWPYYVGIRPFSHTSMTFPVELNAPSFTMTTTYKRRKYRKKPKVISYIDGPFYPDTALPPRERAGELREKLYEAMRLRSLESDCEYIRYIKEKKE